MGPHMAPEPQFGHLCYIAINNDIRWMEARMSRLKQEVFFSLEKQTFMLTEQEVGIDEVGKYDWLLPERKS